MANSRAFHVTLPTAARWQLEQLHTRLECTDPDTGRAIAPPDPGGGNDPGTHCRAIYDPRGPGIVLHWADLRLANAWKSYIAQLAASADVPTLLRQAVSLADPNNKSPEAVQYRASPGYRDPLRMKLAALLGAIANYYNACNIPWSSDPEARGLYRVWIAGTPDNVGSRTSTEFDRSSNYSSEWFDSTREHYPNVGRTTLGGAIAYGRRTDDNLGIIPRKLVAAMRAARGAGRSVKIAEFRQQAGLQVVISPSVANSETGLPPSSTDPGNEPMFSESIMNWAYVDVPLDMTGHVLDYANYTPYAQASVQIALRQMYPWSRGVGVDGDGGSPQYECWPDAELRAAAGLPPNTCNRGSFSWLGYDTANLLGDSAEWDHRGSYMPTVDSDTSYVWVRPGLNDTVPAVAPLALYLQWAKEWAAVIQRRLAAQTIIDARKHAVYTNIMYSQSFSALLEAAEGTLRDAEGQRHAPDPNVTIAAQAVSALGGALAPATYGISAVVGAVVAGGLTVWDAAREHAVTGLYKDDLGRWKPAFERSWLGGKVVSSDLRNALNIEPNSVLVSAPPGYTPATGLGSTTGGSRVGSRVPVIRSSNASTERALDRVRQASTDRMPQVVRTVTGLTPDQIARLVGASNELCSTWVAYSDAEKRARLAAIGFTGDPASVIALLDDRCATILAEAEPPLTDNPLAPQTNVEQQVADTGAPRKSVWPWVAGGAAVLVLGGLGVYFLLSDDDEPPV